MNEIKEGESSENNNPNSTEKNQIPKNIQTETQNKILSKEKVKLNLPNKKDLSNEILYFSVNQESK